MRRKFILPAIAAALAVGVMGTTASADQPSRTTQSNDCAARNSRGRDLQVVGLVADGTLVCFEDDRPGRAKAIGAVTGLVQDTSLVGIDYRPANNVLYGLGNAGGVYTIDANTAQATLRSRLNQPLQGTDFGVDFNPTVDRLRIVSNTGQNLRTNVDDGTTTVDGDAEHPRRHAGQPGPRRDRRRLHEQRRRSEHGDDAVRRRHDQRQHSSSRRRRTPAR